MRISILSVGRKMPAWIRSGYGEYVKRLPAEIKVELVELKPEERGAGMNAEKAMALEGARILAAIPEGGLTIHVGPHASRARLRVAEVGDARDLLADVLAPD